MAKPIPAAPAPAVLSVDDFALRRGRRYATLLLDASGCWQSSMPSRLWPVDERTRQRHAAVHQLLDQGVGLLECARRLGWALNTVKRYARAERADQLQRPPQYRETMVVRSVTTCIIAGPTSPAWS